MDPRKLEALGPVFLRPKAAEGVIHLARTKAITLAVSEAP